ncbi:MAG TPA: hypothetical protein VJ994_14225 [Paracoccaceae bacterium]|nr:hypothetical protein [Paracoccaceae bacterium]
MFLLAVVAACPAAAEEGERFETSTGVSILLTPVVSMSCDGLARKLGEIDATGYRGARPEPASRRDHRLFDYETAVSMRYYTTCVDMSARPVAPSSVFRGGFEPAGAGAAD